MDEIPNGSTVLADKAYDADERVREKLAEKKCTAVIPPRSNRNNPSTYDTDIYKGSSNEKRCIYFFGLFKQGDNFFSRTMLFCFQHIDVLFIQREQGYFSTGNGEG